MATAGCGLRGGGADCKYLLHFFTLAKTELIIMYLILLLFIFTNMSFFATPKKQKKKQLAYAQLKFILQKTTYPYTLL